ncbi:hypothetical protein ACFRNT_13605 [Streptomyces sp. NPDC056697]|uniref:hypothetical protein n=1 Tax=Streptomyces sp. NPDC056697 TaxID=3345915 RepID=UPI00367F8DF5
MSLSRRASARTEAWRCDSDLRDGALEYPYHGWLFETGSGQCTRIPSLPPGRSRPHAALRTYPAEVAYGLVWSCLGDAFLPPPRLPEYVDDRWRLGAGEPNTLKCGMRLLTENFRDKAHFPFVHADSMGHVDKVVEPCPITRDGWRLGWSCSLGSEGVPKELAEEFSHRLDYHITLPVFASICVSSPSGGRRLVAQVAPPVSVNGRTVRQFWLAGTDAESTAQGADLADVLGFERQVFEEDHPIGVGGGDEFGAGSVYQGAGRFWEGVAVFLGLLGPVRLPGRPHETVGHWPGSAFAA